MGSLNIKKFLASQGYDMLEDGYAEMRQGCGVTISVNARYSFGTRVIQFTFWCLQIPTAQGPGQLVMSCYTKRPITGNQSTNSDFSQSNHKL